MVEAFHILALSWLAFIAAIWSSKGGLNVTIKLFASASAAFSAVIVAGDWM